jgi:Fur family ferric uptake transcriptional regulator
MRKPENTQERISTMGKTRTKAVSPDRTAVSPITPDGASARGAAMSEINCGIVECLPELNKLREYINGRGMRCTPERDAIVSEIFTRRAHFKAEDLYQRLRAQNIPVSRASVYRTIPLLQQAGLLIRVFQEDGLSYYEPAYGQRQHGHLRCLACGLIEEFTDPSFSQMARRLRADTGFWVESIRPLVNGLCPSCQRKKGITTGGGNDHILAG